MHFHLTTQAKNRDGEVTRIEISFAVRATADEGDGPEPTDLIADTIESVSDEFVDGIMNLLGDTIGEEIGPLEKPKFYTYQHVKMLKTY